MGRPRKTIIEAQAEMPDLVVLKVDGAFAVTVKSPICGHVWTAEASSLRKGQRCGRCSDKAKKGVLEYQAESPDLLILKVEDSRNITVLGTCNHVWVAEAGNLRAGQRCGLCCSYGYKTDKAGFLYFMERPGELQIGITNDPKKRLKEHAREGWELVQVDGPHCGQEIFDRENAIKKHLRENDLLIDGTHENWLSSMWSPHSITAIEKAKV